MTDVGIITKAKRSIEKSFRMIGDEIGKKVIYITNKSPLEHYFDYNSILSKVEEALRKFEEDTNEIMAPQNQSINSDIMNND